MASILVADDDDDIRRLVALKLRAAGHEVTDAADGVTALELARRDPPDLALLDLMMPGLTGLEVITQLRGDATFPADVPLVLLSARAQESDVAAGLAAGATDHLAKPFSPRELVARIVPYLERRPPEV